MQNRNFEHMRYQIDKPPSLTRVCHVVLQDLLPVIDAFDAAASQVKADTDGEKKIAASYQVCQLSIHQPMIGVSTRTSFILWYRINCNILHIHMKDSLVNLTTVLTNRPRIAFVFAPTTP